MFYKYLKLILLSTLLVHAAPELFITYGEKLERFKDYCKTYKKVSLLPVEIKNKCNVYISKTNHAFKFGYTLDRRIVNYTLTQNQEDQYLSLLDKLNERRNNILTLIYIEMKKAQAEDNPKYYYQLIYGAGVDLEFRTSDYKFMKMHKDIFARHYYYRQKEEKEKKEKARIAKKEQAVMKLEHEAIESFKEEEASIISNEREEKEKTRKYAQDIREIEEAKRDKEKFNESIGIKTKTVEEIKKERREKKFRQKARTAQIRQVQKKYSNIIMSDCQRKWGTDYKMVKYCANKQTEAHNSLSGLSDNVITRNCRSKWGTDYSMVKYCVDKQYNAYQNISSLPDDTIMSNCRQKWGTDFSMIKYCVDKQTQAKRSLGL